MGFVTLSGSLAPRRVTRGMIMNRLAAAALAAALLAVPASAGAQTIGTFTFATVDEVALQGSNLVLTGILQGESVPTTRNGYISTSPTVGETCQRFALLAQAKPGQYLLEITVASYGATLTGCRLRRAVP
jgi:hypothetical protein